MRITRMEKSAVTTSVLNPQEMNTIKTVCTQLKTAVPGLQAMLQNPNNLAFLMKLLEAIGNNPNAVNVLRNGLTTIKSAMDKDSTATMAIVSQHA